MKKSTLKQIEKSIGNMKKGKVSAPVDIDSSIKLFLKSISPAEQKRLNILMRKNNDGKLTMEESSEMLKLVKKIELITLENAILLGGFRFRSNTSL